LLDQEFSSSLPQETVETGSDNSRRDGELSAQKPWPIVLGYDIRSKPIMRGVPKLDQYFLGHLGVYLFSGISKYKYPVIKCKAIF